MPEMNSAAESEENKKTIGPMIIFLLQNVGLIAGFGVILLMAVYGADINFEKWSNNLRIVKKNNNVFALFTTCWNLVSSLCMLNVLKFLQIMVEFLKKRNIAYQAIQLHVSWPFMKCDLFILIKWPENLPLPKQIN